PPHPCVHSLPTRRSSDLRRPGRARARLVSGHRAPSCFQLPPVLAGQEGLEPPTCGFGDRRSTNWSYWPEQIVSFLARLLVGSVRSEEHTSELQSRVDLVC